MTKQLITSLFILTLGGLALTASAQEAKVDLRLGTSPAEATPQISCEKSSAGLRLTNTRRAQIAKIGDSFTITFYCDDGARTFPVGKTAVRLDAWVGLNVQAQYQNVTTETEVQCVTAPCDPIKETKINIYDVRAWGAEIPEEDRRVKVPADARTNMPYPESKRDAVETRKATSTEKRVEMQQGLAKRKAEHVGKVLMATIERLEKIVARVESRIEKLKAEGVDTTMSAGYAAEAKVHLDKARLALGAFSSLTLSFDKARENFGAVRDVAAEVKMHLKEAHTSLAKAVRSLKGSNVTATSTVSATSSTQ